MFRTGLDCCLAEPPPLLDGARLGLLMNSASVDVRGHYACDLLAARFPGQLTTLFSPQHGLWGEPQANMVESPHGWYARLGLPVCSLYGATRRPTAEMLAGLDCLIVDLQDVGTRVYTFAWTVLECMRACAEWSVPIVVLDRPNPIGGAVVEGPPLNLEHRSFVGGAAIPLRHGLTLGELARWLNGELRIGARLDVVPMTGWRRAMLFPETNRNWIATSPNMPRWETTLVYPGQVLLEGTNLSEGRGTTLPFELCGAPWIDPFDLVETLSARELPGVTLRPMRFQPTFDKWRGISCGGVAIQIHEPCSVRSVGMTVALVNAVRARYRDEFQWSPPPYEYELTKMPIDILFGSERLRQQLQRADPLSPEEIAELVACDESTWWQSAAPYLLYR